jgi:hypothetical protein
MIHTILNISDCIAFMPLIGSVAWVGLAASTIGGAVEANKANQTAKNSAAQALQASKDAQVNIPQLNTEVQNESASNAALSNSMEQQYNPYINALRQTSAGSLNQYLTPSDTTNKVQSNLMNQLNANGQPLAASALQTNASNAAQQQLNLGGTLDQDTQNAAMRAGAAQAGGMSGPGGGLGLGRDLSARDLGLSSLALQNQRISNAANIGQQQSAYGLQAQQAQAANTANYSNILNNMQQEQFNKNLALSQFTQGIQQPAVGLSPSAVAGVAVGNSNLIGSAGQQAAAIGAQQAAGQSNLAGQALGFGLNAVGNMNWASGTGSTTASPQDTTGALNTFNQSNQTGSMFNTPSMTYQQPASQGTGYGLDYSFQPSSSQQSNGMMFNQPAPAQQSSGIIQ